VPEYQIKGIVCFVGAHYMSFIKQDMCWKRYDDAKPIQVIQSWAEVLDEMMRYGILPTLIVYERVPT